MGAIVIINLMCVGVILIGVALVASHYLIPGSGPSRTRRQPYSVEIRD
jgi:hypothetical protein